MLTRVRQLREGNIQPNKVQVWAGGLEAIKDGFQYMREGKVSAAKLVVVQSLKPPFLAVSGPLGGRRLWSTFGTGTLINGGVAMVGWDGHYQGRLLDAQGVSA